MMPISGKPEIGALHFPFGEKKGTGGARAEVKQEGGAALAKVLILRSVRRTRLEGWRQAKSEVLAILRGSLRSRLRMRFFANVASHRAVRLPILGVHPAMR